MIFCCLRLHALHFDAATSLIAPACFGAVTTTKALRPHCNQAQVARQMRLRYCAAFDQGSRKMISTLLCPSLQKLFRTIDTAKPAG
jgi:hypothetical protein